MALTPLPHAIEHQHAVLILERAPMGDRHHRIGLIGRPQIDRRRLAHLPHQKPEDKTRQDHAIDLLGTPRVGAPRQTVKIASKDQKVALRKDEVPSPNVGRSVNLISR